ncbi:alpha/beta hydrolase-fold protein [Salipaludibacillus sp. HK11]|uniref:alpha/beta hydrolase-fold protein n=1 Tax=Salipaludibacillus sp. HK11 TaxID=3394320 RepID=UPI0039FBAEA7
MKQGIRIFALVMVIILVLSNLNFNTLAAGEVKEVSMEGYNVLLPQGYDDDNGRAYPVLYLMPEDGTASKGDEMVSMIQSEMETDQAGNMISVMPTFDGNEDFRIAMDKVIIDVDSNFNTIPTANQRAVLGVGIGGYMAYIMGMTDEETVHNQPDTIKNIGSIRGNFTGDDNGLYEQYGNVYDIISTIGKDNISNYYTYLDGPTEDSYTYLDKSTNAIGTLFINWDPMMSYDVHEYTARYGSYDDAYLQESVSRVINRFSQQFYSDMVSGDVSLSPQVAASSVEHIEVDYTIDINDSFSELSEHATEMTVEVSLTDPEDGSLLHSDKKAIDVNGPDTFEGMFSIPNIVNGTSSTVSVTAEMLGFKIDIGSKSLVRIMDTGLVPDEQLIDLMGDWKFNAYKPYSNTESVPLDQIDNVTKDVWSSWGTVQPALGWWSADFDESLDGNSNWLGYAWYVREFDIPANFAKEDLILALGKIDEADESYVNGVRVGANGIPEAGGAFDQSNSSPWDVERVYDLDASILNYGGTNTIAVRMANSNGGGGWYEGPVGIYSPAAYNRTVGLPSELTDTAVKDQIVNFVEGQHAAIEAKDLDAFAETVAPDYFQAGFDKNRLLNKVKADVAGDGDVTVTDTKVNVYNYQGMYLYQSERTIQLANGETVSEEVNDYYIIEDGEVILYGDHDTFYVDSYPSTYAASEKGLEGETEMNYRVYLPDGYFDSNKRYPVSYLLHQFNSTSKSYEMDGIDGLLSEGMANGDIEDTIVVIPDSDGLSWWRDDWELMVTEELVPFINENYRTIEDARFNGTAGASMGGQGAYGIGLRNPNHFSSVISFFGAFSYGGENSPNVIAEEVSDTYLQNFSHYFISGNRDVYGFGVPAIQLDNQLRTSSVDHVFEIENGEHDSAFYTPYVIDAFGYVSDHMYSTGGAIADHAIGGMEAEVDGDVLKLSAKLELNDFTRWMNVIPDSRYTENTNPDMVIPVTVKIEQDGKTVFTEVDYPAVVGSESIDFEKEVILGGSVVDPENLVAADVDLEKDFTATVFASLLDTNKELGTFEYAAPKEEDPVTDPIEEEPTPGEGDSNEEEPVAPGEGDSNDGEEPVAPGEDKEVVKDDKEGKDKEEISDKKAAKGENLPDTSTNTFNIGLIGSLFFLFGSIGFGVIWWRKRRFAS